MISWRARVGSELEGLDEGGKSPKIPNLSLSAYATCFILKMLQTDLYCTITTIISPSKARGEPSRPGAEAEPA